MVRVCTLLVLTAVFAGVVGTGAVRPEPAVHAGQWAAAVTTSSYQELADVAVGSHEHVPFTLLTKYLIRPSLAKQFAEGWLRFRKVVQEAKGSRTINLSKTLSNNLVFYSYEEWDCMHDFVKFAKESYAAKELIEYIEEHDIPIEIKQLVPAVPFNKPDQKPDEKLFDAVSSVAGMSMKALEDFLGDTQDVELPQAVTYEKSSLDMNARNDSIIILTKFLVKPSRIVQFVKAADLVTKAVSANEKGNLVYGLSKPLDDDVTFWTYAIWEDKEALKKHLESVYVKVFLKYILDNDIYTKTTPLIAIEQMDK